MRRDSYVIDWMCTMLCTRPIDSSICSFVHCVIPFFSIQFVVFSIVPYIVLFFFISSFSFLFITPNNLKCSWYKESRVKSMQQRKFKWHISGVCKIWQMQWIWLKSLTRLVVAFHAFYTAFQCVSLALSLSLVFLITHFIFDFFLVLV